MKKIIQFTAGKGPVECCWVVAKVLKYFIEEVNKNALIYEIIHIEKGLQNGTILSVMLHLNGQNVKTFLNSWIGTIQWVGTSTFRKHYKRKNWFIGCFLVEQSAPLIIDKNDIQFQAIRSSGPGGQHVNKVSSAIRALHKPSKLQVVVMDSRSQHQNKKIAIQRLQEKVTEYNLQKLKNEMDYQWENHLNLQRGNPIKVFKGSDFKRQKTTKKYKSKRQEIKNNLKKQSWD